MKDISFGRQYITDIPDRSEHTVFTMGSNLHYNTLSNHELCPTHNTEHNNTHLPLKPLVRFYLSAEWLRQTKESTIWDSESRRERRRGVALEETSRQTQRGWSFQADRWWEGGDKHNREKMDRYPVWTQTTPPVTWIINGRPGNSIWS